MNREKKAIAASVHQRLLNKARETKRPFNELLQYYAMEKFLLRMSRSQFAEDFVLKGALLLRTFGIAEFRPTRDIDLLKYGDHAIPEVEKVIAECCRLEVEEDGLEFDPKSVSGQEIREQQAYQGIRISVKGKLGTARVHLQIDMGFGDVVTPEPLWVEYPTIMDEERPRLRAYTLESAIAEKYQAMVDMGIVNSRMKDYYDIYYVTEHRSFDGPQLQSAIKQTFQRRKTGIPEEVPLALTRSFYEDETKIKQWKAFIGKVSDDLVPSELETVVARIAIFLWPVTDALSKGNSFDREWNRRKEWD
ncbi:nucleotidyl transferase AbiEii/AbiGii toxin family protein [Aliifodinibius sp. S!AR15-10]|uniref:nucleotidyl transferase AbiEii/AbiGii toxin family protein n=1 Tax=Aliifodinibius sp. S!AR15-10 TaxID=2950437 RepID=UPI0028653B3D|nr:nucleotidyl transferase AbiEii/AbiGii toxin family protein [Aliifodinibius sp. S!AR15-10]MDR8389831.1 nucleotidyl transferase AbiEii/AbiGii toxin family protein [Aliifodinibius sp. S!AR15-10]